MCVFAHVIVCVCVYVDVSVSIWGHLFVCMCEICCFACLCADGLFVFVYVGIVIVLGCMYVCI